ncbi:hypothetical protein BGX33_005531 [Mortierella sp. NVP41]|nr:hypothetical protein BGX33_005531 [Mortierella sp. NVP41]
MSDHQVNPAQSYQTTTTTITVDTTSVPHNSTTTGANTIQPIAIPGSSSTIATDANGQPIISTIISPSKCVGKKTGTRSTFCPNTLRKGTKLTEEDFEHHEQQQQQQPQSTGWLGMLGLKKSANYGDGLCKHNEPYEQSYY